MGVRSWKVIDRCLGGSPVTSDLWMRNPAANWEYRRWSGPETPHTSPKRGAIMRIVVAALLLLIIASPLTPAPDPAVASLAALSGPAFDTAYLRTLIPVHEEAVEIAMEATLTADHTELLKWNQRVVERKNAQVRQMLTWLREAGASPAQRNVGVATPAVKKLRGLQDAALESAD